MTAEHLVVQAVTADQKNDDSETSTSNQLRNDWDVQSVDQSIAIGSAPNNQRRQSHGEEMDEEVVQAQSSHVPARRDKIVDRGGERAMIPAHEKCAQPEEEEKRNFAGSVERDQDGGRIEHETDWDNQGASPRPQASEAVGHVRSGYSSPCADLNHGEPQCQSSLPCREVFLFLNQVRALPHDAGVPGEVPEPAGYQHREICQRTQSSRRCMCSSE